MSSKRISGKITGAILLVVAIASVLFFKPKKELEVKDTTIRPIKSSVVGKAFKNPDLYFPGLVASDQKVDLSFNVAGQILTIPIKKGQEVKKGQLLAQLDDNSFQNEVKNAQAELTRSESTFKRMEKALKANAISKEEFSKAKADFDKAKAKLEIAKKNLDDTKILARFDGVIADIYADNYDTVSPGQAAIALQNNSLVNIVVSIPEQYLIHRRNKDKNTKTFSYYAVFDALPDEKFELSIKEYSTQADFKTQTYTVSFQMKAPEKFNILPGMSATVVIKNFIIDDNDPTESIAVETDCIGINSSGDHFVWILEKTDVKGVFKTIQRIIKVGRRSGTTVQVLEGLKQGDRIATAGITVLVEGRRVSLLAEKTGEEK